MERARGGGDVGREAPQTQKHRASVHNAFPELFLLGWLGFTRSSHNVPLHVPEAPVQAEREPGA